MITRFRNEAAVIYKSIGLLPGGFKNVFRETKDSLEPRKLRYEGKPLSRQQEILLKKNSAALQKLFLFSVVQTVPVLGWLPIIIALTYPRLLLTDHFWSEDQKIEFMQQEHAERKHFGLELRKHIGSLSHRIEPSIFHSVGIFSSLNKLSPEHTKLLANANAIHGNDLSRLFTPSFLSRRMMNSTAAFIIKDDALLRAEGIENLSEAELQDALLQRGFNSVCMDRPEMILDYKKCLRSWLENNRTVSLDEASYLLHCIALSQQITEKNTI